MAQPSPSYKAQPRKPKLQLPRGACDTHFHVFGPQSRFPFAPERSYTPTCDAPKETLFALHKHLGIERGVVVQSAAHGFDNSAAADLIAARPQRYRGVALVRAATGTLELARLHAPRASITWIIWAAATRSMRCSPWRRASRTSAGTCRSTSPARASPSSRRH
ncbi:MAG: hypothetical protein E6H63_09445 [Betaproteobacteria bacterium]|nr:MAG: hypothetical protein E6H63_09445 [Betaproteobacteria bacterium]